MVLLTPAERRGAWILVLLFAIGAARDLWRSTRPFSGLEARESVAVAASEAPGAADKRGVNPEPGKTPKTPGSTVLLDLNQASASDLDQLPGIGPILAERIVAYRAVNGPFRRVEELRAVRGIGPKLFARMAARIRVEPESTRTAPAHPDRGKR